MKTYPITLLCRVMNVSRSAYYAWNSSINETTPSEHRVLSKLKELFEASKKTYGSRRLTKELKASGFSIGRFKVRHFMARLGFKVRYPKRYRLTTDSNHHFTIAPNILDRNFNVSAPNRVWTTDITYVWTLQGWLYVAVVMDLYSRQIIGWAIDEHMRASLCVRALQMAYYRRKPAPGLVHHSDKGSQYASDEYCRSLKKMGMEQSMSRKGNCWDNAPTERFFRSLKHEYLNYEKFSNKDITRSNIIDYLAFYNGRRIHSVIGYKTPLVFEKEFYENRH